MSWVLASAWQEGQSGLQYNCKSANQEVGKLLLLLGLRVLMLFGMKLMKDVRDSLQRKAGSYTPSPCPAWPCRPAHHSRGSISWVDVAGHRFRSVRRSQHTGPMGGRHSWTPCRPCALQRRQQTHRSRRCEHARGQNKHVPWELTITQESQHSQRQCHGETHANKDYRRDLATYPGITSSRNETHIQT